ncbi:hypothetical protein [Leptothermofonsia sp. ETS-13]|uniref:hypothetical protein n=1 Tax=Leptothermofonsia sp. ETS-13 TaxID=3035696 RepID=UPI003BA0B3E6
MTRKTDSVSNSSQHCHSKTALFLFQTEKVPFNPGILRFETGTSLVETRTFQLKARNGLLKGLTLEFKLRTLPLKTRNGLFKVESLQLKTGAIALKARKLLFKAESLRLETEAIAPETGILPYRT